MLDFNHVTEKLTTLDVQEEPVLTEDYNQIPGYKLIRRLSDDCKLAIVSNKYQVYQHLDAFYNACDKINNLGLNAELKRIKINADQRHNAVHITWTFPEISFDIDGSPTEASFEMLNSTDGLMGYREFLGLYRMRCDNGLVIGDDIFKSYRRHYGDSFQADIDNIDKFYAALDNYDRLKTAIAASREVKASREFINRLIKIGFPAKLVMKEFANRFFRYVDNYNEFLRNYNTIWAYYAVLTHWLSHRVARRNIRREVSLSRKLSNLILTQQHY